jgi:hypothetical protein
MVRVILASGMVAVGMWSRGFLRQGLGAAFAACLVFGSPFVTGSARADTGLCAAPQGPAQYPDKFDWNGSYLFGDLNGVRSKGQQSGITLCSQYNAYVYDNANGWSKARPSAQGQLFSWIDVDLDRFTHIDGLSIRFCTPVSIRCKGARFRCAKSAAFQPSALPGRSPPTGLERPGSSGNFWMAS